MYSCEKFPHKYLLCFRFRHPPPTGMPSQRHAGGDGEEYKRPTIISEKDLKDFDQIMRLDNSEDGWAGAQGEIDYSYVKFHIMKDIQGVDHAYKIFIGIQVGKLYLFSEFNPWSSGCIGVKLLTYGAMESIPGLSSTVSEIRYLLLPSWYMIEMLEQCKFLKNDLTNCIPKKTVTG